MIVIFQRWEESEKGWGCRPDGCSLHLNDEDRKNFIMQYWDLMPDSAPAEYSRPYDFSCTVNIDDEDIINDLKMSTNGIRLSESELQKLNPKVIVG